MDRVRRGGGEGDGGGEADHGEGGDLDGAGGWSGDGYGDGEEDSLAPDALPPIPPIPPMPPMPPMPPIEIPITDVIDLHSFRPAEVADVVREYLDAAYAKGLRELRIVHGRGIGVQRRMVRVVLERDPRVVSFDDAAPEAGGWGATWVRLR